MFITLCNFIKGGPLNFLKKVHILYSPGHKRRGEGKCRYVMYLNQI
jgi:hypothetical protein